MRHIADYLQLMKEFVAQLTGIYTKCLTTNRISGKYTLQSIHYVLVFKNQIRNPSRKIYLSLHFSFIFSIWKCFRTMTEPI
jgi:hypothetical protein